MAAYAVSQALAAYRDDRAPVVVSVERIDRTIAILLCSPLASLDIESLARADIARYKDMRLAEGVADPTILRELATLRSAARLAWREGRIARVPPIPMPPRGQPRQRHLSEAEVTRILSAVAH